MNLRDSLALLGTLRPRSVEPDEDIDLAHDLADLIVRVRINAGLSQTEFAELAGTTQARISELEHGAANPKLATVSRILTVVSRLLEDKAATQESVPEPQNVTEAYQRATTDQAANSNLAIAA